MSDPHKYPGLVAILAFFLFISSTAFAASVLRDLERLESVIEHTIARLESDIELDAKDAGDYSSRARLQFELAALAAGHPDLLEEDYYNLALSLIARNFGEYTTACQLLRKEVNMQTLRAAREWLSREITELEQLIASSHDKMQVQLKTQRNYKAILQDLKTTLARAGVR